jgi:hypothetical protein
VLAGCLLAGSADAPARTSFKEFRGNQFIALTNFSSFASSSGHSAELLVLTSPEISTGIPFDELIASWNVNLPQNGSLGIEARVFHQERPTKWYHLGRWSIDAERHPRESVLHQADADGDVDTDTLKLKQRAERFQLRLTCQPAPKGGVKLRNIGICVTDSSWRGTALTPNRAAWGTKLEVPERSQMVYPDGGVLCSPTTISMLLGYWSRRLERPEVDRDVPEIAKAVYDANWKGTGNWVFNTAFAGGLPGIAASVSRLSDVAELEDLIASGVPVGLSVCYNRLRGRGRQPSGHLVVCVGFTAEGDPVINDPGTTKNVQKVFPRKNLVDAWAYSKNAVYLVAPEGKLPLSRFGHW